MYLYEFICLHINLHVYIQLKQGSLSSVIFFIVLLSNCQPSGQSDWVRGFLLQAHPSGCHSPLCDVLSTKCTTGSNTTLFLDDLRGGKQAKQ